ncbi:MAG: hypothetical protein II036_05735 [Oscillospiraceae bacterium]|nr:hypothetical protein [Oscillospiraceae bacterium]
MTNREIHKLVSKYLRNVPKEQRRYAHAAAHKHYMGKGFDQWQLVMADKLMYQHGLCPSAFVREDMARNWMEQPD